MIIAVIMFRINGVSINMVFECKQPYFILYRILLYFYISVIFIIFIILSLILFCIIFDKKSPYPACCYYFLPLLIDMFNLEHN